MESPSDQPMRIAIVGGGISGVSTAYYLMQRARRLGTRLDIQLFEAKQTLGGNADTVVVNLGRYQEAGGAAYDYLRWADLGVNDANLATYTLMKQVMTDIGYLQHMKPLEDTVCYHTPGRPLALTDDSALIDGVSDPHFNLLNADAGLLWPLIKVVHRTALDLLGLVAPDYTCAAYFQDCIDDPCAMLSEAARQLNISVDWHAAGLSARLTRVRDDYYYPRISAMYFTDPGGPATMPLQSPFEYYQLQEGGVAPDRRYFDHGAQTWIEALADHVVATSTPQVSTTIRVGEPVGVRVAADVIAVLGTHGCEVFDICIMATHADDAARALAFDDSATAFAERVRRTLSAVRYTYGYAVCHTAAGRLPVNRNVWRTYNIPIRSGGDSVFPYRIDYVANRHQKDAGNPDYDRAGLPQYFVSLVDDLNLIPRDNMLDRVVDPQALPAAWRDRLPQATWHSMALGALGAVADTGYRHQHASPAPALDGKAWTVFKHNVLDAGCIHAQLDMLALNLDWAQQRMRTTTSGRGGSGKSQPALLFGGGWTVGAGLQEQCLRQSQAIGVWVLPD